MNRKSELCQKGRRLGKYRASVDLVESICQDLGNDICAYSEKELTEKLEKQGGIKYYVEQGEGDDISHIGITSCRGRGPVSLRFGEPYGRLWDLVPPVRQYEPFINGSLPLINIRPLTNGGFISVREVLLTNVH
jgi:hypothetical protein